MRAKEFEPNILVIFDIDDTLVNTQTEVHVVKDGKVVNSLNSHDFTHYKLQPGETFDFKDFRNAREFFEKSKPIIPMMNQLKRDIATGNDVVMVTARADFDDKELFLDTFRKYGIDIDKVHVYRAGNLPSGSTEERKKKIIKGLLDKKNYTKAIMYDDAIPNLQLFVSLKKEHPNTIFYAWHVSLEGNASEYMRESMNEGSEITMWTNPEYQGADVDDKYYEKQPVKRVDISKLTPFEPADKMDPKDNHDNMMKFVDKIKAGEKVKPIVIVPHEGEWLIVDGHHRYFAHLKAGADKIRVVIADPKDLTWRDDVPESVQENFADGKKKGKSRPGRVKKAGASCKGSVSSLRAKASKYGGEKGKMYHWCANMKGGKN